MGVKNFGIEKFGISFCSALFSVSFCSASAKNFHFVFSVHP